MKKAIGFLLLSLPFLAVTVPMVIDLGWQVAVLMWLCIFLVVAIIFAGLILITK